jgi:hypothetical protein
MIDADVAASRSACARLPPARHGDSLDRLEGSLMNRSLVVIGATIVAIGAALSSTPGCSSTDSDPSGSGQAGSSPQNSPDCPAQPPFPDARCDHPGLICRYDDPGGFCPGAQEVSVCRGRDWDTEFILLPSCMDDEPCPATPPKENTGCNVKKVCHYCVGGVGEQFSCLLDTHTWIDAGGSVDCP